MMLLITPSKRLSNICSLRPVVRHLQHTSNIHPLTDGKQKKKFSELTPQEIETEVKDNLVRLRKSFEKDEKDNYVVPIFKKSLLHADRLAIKDADGEYSYLQIYVSAKRLAIQISNICGSAAMRNIGYLCANNVLIVLAQWACWVSGQVAMPLDMCNSAEMLKALLKDSKAIALIVSPEYEKLGWEITEAMDISLVIIDHGFMVSPNTTLLSVPRVLLTSLGTVIVEGTCSNDFYTKANAMLLYTMGTTGKPKGVVMTHRNIDAQVKSLTKAWKYEPNDCLMHALPLHHAHGFINAFMCPLNVGGRILMHDQFNSKDMWSTLLGINTPVKDRVSFFMAVPALYNSLITEYEKTLSKNDKMASYVSNYCKENVRLMVSGGSPLAPATFRRWREITGHKILECYGATEMGLALSSPYVNVNDPENFKRQPGLVGLPLPDVRVRLVGTNEKVLIDCVGEFTNNEWNVQFVDPKTFKPNNKRAQEVKTNRIESENKAFESEYSETQSSFIEIFSNTLKKISENFALAVTKTFELFVQPKSSTEKFQTDNTYPINQIKPEAEGVFVTDIDADGIKHGENEGSKNSKRLLGELQVSGPNVYKLYFGNPEATHHAFNRDFFRTGDMAIFQDGFFKILGRNNVDVIEIGGKKISSYDIESLILEHPSVRDVTVLAVPTTVDNTLDHGNSEGQNPTTHVLGVVCVLQKETELDLDTLNTFCAKLLPKHLLPTKLKIVDELPRSNMAEINRKALKDIFNESNEDPSSSTQ